MENALFANVKKLYDHNLYECVIPAAGVLLTLLHHDRTLATQEVEYQVQQYLAGAQVEERHFRAGKRYCGLAAIESVFTEFGDVEMRRRLAECCREIGNTRSADNIRPAGGH